MNSSRHALYGILITLAVGAAAGRIMSTQLVFEPSIHRDENNPNDKRRLWPTKRPAQMPTFSSNDRSRWATVYSLVEKGTYIIGTRDMKVLLTSAMAPIGVTGPLEAAVIFRAGNYFRIKSDTGIIFEDGWQSVDKVLQPAKMKFYSSKPPLLSTLVAGLYWLLKLLLGWTLTANPNAVVRTILFLVNVVPFWIYLKQLVNLVERFGGTEWGRFFTVAAAAFATLVAPFLNTFNNHTLATFCVLFTLVSVIKIWERAPRRRGGAADQDSVSPWQYHLAAGFFAASAVCNELPALSFAVAVFVLLIYWAPRRALIFFLAGAVLPAVGNFATNYAALGQWRPAYSEFGSPWYEYEGSHWLKVAGQVRTGIDWARFQESRLTYLFHVLFGHHGWFSLTPLWLLAFLGMAAGCWRWATGRQAAGDWKTPALPWFLAPLTLLISVVVIGFYASVDSRNYGGYTVGLRWLMWLTPLWLMCLLPMADWLGKSKWGRRLAYVCLAFSVLAANYSSWNPWRHPWLYDLFMALGWPGY